MPTKLERVTGAAVVPDKPKMYKVTLHNDHYTTMDFVVAVLMKVFLKSPQVATEIMLTVHNTGKCDVSVYPYDIAITKKMQAQNMAEENGFPLLVTVSEADL